MFEEPLTFESFIQLRRTNPDLYHTLEVHRWMIASMEQLWTCRGLMPPL